MTQVKLRSAGGKGMTQAAWKYAMACQNARESLNKARDRHEAEKKADKMNITLPKLKWMENKTT
jgi:hypothetical protein